MTISGAAKLETPTNTGRLSSVVSSADCRSAKVLSTPDFRKFSEVKQNGEAAGTSSLKSVDLVLAMTGVVHRSNCGAMGRVYKGIAPEILESDIEGFLVTRRMVGCGACLRAYRTEAE